MTYLRRIIRIIAGLLMAAAIQYIPLFTLACFASRSDRPLTFSCWMPLLAVFLFLNVRPLPKTAPTGRIQQLAEAVELLQLFAAEFLISLIIQILFLWAVVFRIIPTPGGVGRPLLLSADLTLVILSLNLMDEITDAENSTDRMREQLSQYLEDAAKARMELEDERRQRERAVQELADEKRLCSQFRQELEKQKRQFDRARMELSRLGLDEDEIGRAHV